METTKGSNNIPNHLKNILSLFAYSLLAIVILYTIYNSTSNRSFLEYFGDAGMICGLCWMILTDGYVKNKIGAIKITKYGQIFRYLAMVFLAIYLLLHLR